MSTIIRSQKAMSLFRKYSGRDHLKCIITLLTLLLSGSHLANAQTDSIKKTEVQELGFAVERMPEYIGGFEALKEYIAASAIYTENTKSSNISGKVFVSFWVEADGLITEPIILRGLHPELDSISLELIREMPPWKPALQRGKPIKCKYTLPIQFTHDSIQTFNDPALQQAVINESD